MIAFARATRALSSPLMKQSRVPFGWAVSVSGMPQPQSPGSGTPQPQTPGTTFAGSFGQRSRNSTAPMSQTAVPSPFASVGRGSPRWSVAGQPIAAPLSRTGLPVAGTWVIVGPPLSARGPSCGSTLFWSPLPANEQVPLESRLLPPDVTGVPPQCAGAAPAMIVLTTVTAPPALRMALASG